MSAPDDVSHGVSHGVSDGVSHSVSHGVSDGVSHGVAEATSPTPVFVATGAYSCGKTTTLQWLRDHHGLSIHAEAHPRVVASLGTRTLGHPPDQPFTRIDDPSHFCPLCRGREFCGMVIDLQHRIERAASPGDLLERGVFDPIEFYLRHSGAPEEAMDPGGSESTPEGTAWLSPEWPPVARYARVFLFEVMPALQRPKWGKSTQQRVAEAMSVQARLDRIYRVRGYDVVRVPPGTVEQRGRWVLERLEAP